MPKNTIQDAKNVLKIHRMYFLTLVPFFKLFLGQKMHLRGAFF
jgi:hypothetical protein